MENIAESDYNRPICGDLFEFLSLKCPYPTQHRSPRDMSIRHFQYGGVCLHFTRASFNTVFGKSNFKITLIFSEMTLHFDYIVQAVRYGLVKVSYIIQFDRCFAAHAGFHAEDHFWQRYLPQTFVALSSCRARYFLLLLNLVILLAIPLIMRF